MDLEEANQLLSRMSDVVDYQVSKRGLLESQLFPVTAYICVSFYNSYDALYDILKKVAEKTPPETMGQKSRKILSEIHALSIFYIPLYYFVGRMGEIYKNGGDPRKESKQKRDETLFVLDFWSRLAESYFPGKKRYVYDSNKQNIALNQNDIDWVVNKIDDVSNEQSKALKKSIANLEVVSFLDECEARAKICDHGPYILSDNEILVFREISHLFSGGRPHFPWSETQTTAPYPNTAFALRLKDVSVEFDDFATMEITPTDFTENITGAAIFTRKGDEIKSLDFDTLEDFDHYATNANKELFLKFLKWDRRQRLIAGAYAYCYGYARYTNFVEITDQIDWELSKKTMDIYVPHFMENDFDPGIPRLFRSKAKKKKGGPSLYLIPEED